ncbi:MAG: hypothetical protein NT166_30515 [Candidatus Aminicenantes bacterium]|nr:hypothetical protein [Candidatus Aminicenantes bacterium]
MSILGLMGREEPKNKEEWFARAMDVYDIIIGDSGVVKMMEEYNSKLADLQQGHQTIVLAREANNTLAKESKVFWGSRSYTGDFLKKPPGHRGQK